MSKTYSNIKTARRKEVSKILPKPSLLYPLGIDWVWFADGRKARKSVINWAALIIPALMLVAHPLSWLLLIVIPVVLLTLGINSSDDFYVSRSKIKRRLDRHAQEVVNRKIKPDLHGNLVSPYKALDNAFSHEQFENLSEKEMDWIKHTWNKSLNNAIRSKVMKHGVSNKESINDFGKKSLSKEVIHHLNAIDEIRSEDENKRTLGTMSSKEQELEEFERMLKD